MSSNSSTLEVKSCTDPIVGAILSGWRYDISIISPEMRTDYENHLAECSNCRRRQRIARTIDVLLISISSLSIVAFLLETLTHIVEHYTLPVHLHDTPVVISLQAVAIAGLIISMILWVLVAVATPLPALVKSIPSDIRQRLARRHA
jgi:predicted anti-sigma-YlaC factor YlaD